MFAAEYKAIFEKHGYREEGVKTQWTWIRKRALAPSHAMLHDEGYTSVVALLTEEVNSWSA